jgi:hypothetical protein
VKESLSQVEPELKHFMFQLHEQGIQLIVVQEAAHLLPAFSEKIMQAMDLQFIIS